MKTFTKLLAAGGIALIGAGTLAGIAVADQHGRRGGMGHMGDMGHMGGGMGGGMAGGPGAMFDDFDANSDGRVTQEEIRNRRDERFRRFDANNDGALALDEYQALWADAMRRQMVRGFQRHDTDGDARVTPEEFNAMFETMAERLDADGDGAVTREELRQMMGRHHGGGPRGEREGREGRGEERD